MALTNEEYEKIRRILEERRRDDDYKLAARKKEIGERIPAYRELDGRIAALSMDCSRAMIAAESEETRRELMDRLHAEVLRLRMEKKHLLEENGYPRDYLDGVWHCPRCRYTGFIDG